MKSIVLMAAAKVMLASGTIDATAAAPAKPANQSYPDPQVILQNMVTVLKQVQNVHFEDTIDGNQINTEKLHIDIPGDATCTGPAMKGEVTGTDTREATSQTTSFKASFIWINKKAWVKSKATHQKWAESKATITPFQGFTLNFQTDIFPLPCGGTQFARLSQLQQTSPQIKDLVNLGPDTFQGIPVWHIRFVIPQTDSQGQTYDVQYDLLISEDHYLPYVQTVTIALNPQTTLINTTVLTKFGDQVTVAPPTNPAPARPIIPKTTKVLGASPLGKLDSRGALNVSGETLTLRFKNPGAMLTHLKPGNVIVAGVTARTPRGMLRKITSVSRDGKKEIVTSRPATLQDAIQQGTIHLHQTLRP